MARHSVVVIGGGLAGLSCARRLHEQGQSCLVLEAAESVGGRVASDVVDGFILDRGFQVLLTAYPECQRLLDYSALGLEAFEPGALIRLDGRFHRLSDPWRNWRRAWATLVSPAASWADKWRILRLRQWLTRLTLDEVYQLPETTTIAALGDYGFSNRVINGFFRPFLGGIFLDDSLRTSSRMFYFVFRMFALGDAALPRRGMQAIPQQLAAGLAPGTIRVASPVVRLGGGQLELASGEQIETNMVVVAADAPAADRLLNRDQPRPFQSVTCLYFAASEPPLREPILVLAGDQGGLVNNLCVPSQVSPDYAPQGQALISVSVLGDSPLDDADLEQRVRDELADWYGAATVAAWRHLRTYRVRHALPRQFPPALSPVAKEVAREDGIFICGDYLDTASIQGALVSGRRAADAIVSLAPRKAEE